MGHPTIHLCSNLHPGGQLTETKFFARYMSWDTTPSVVWKGTYPLLRRQWAAWFLLLLFSANDGVSIFFLQPIYHVALCLGRNVRIPLDWSLCHEEIFFYVAFNVLRPDLTVLIGLRTWREASKNNSKRLLAVWSVKGKRSGGGNERKAKASGSWYSSGSQSLQWCEQ